MGKKIKKYKVGTDSETYAISMVEMPAIEEDFVALAKEEEKIEVKLSDDTKHMVYGAVLVPDRDIYRNNGEQEFYISFTKESIEKMSQDFMKEYRQHEVTVDHEDIANEVCVVESWIKADLFKDKSVALGLNEQLPVGTWLCGMKVNNVETWERIKKGELKGFSVESMISLEEFSKIDNNMEIKTDEMGFWTKMREVLKEAFSKKDGVEPIDIGDLATQSGEVEETNLEEQTVAEPTPEPVAEPTPAPVEGETTVDKVEEVAQPAPEPVVEEPKDNHLEELVNSLKQEIEALKEMNTGLQDKIKDLGKQPSAAPVNTNAKPSAASNYTAWREQMARMIG